MNPRRPNTAQTLSETARFVRHACTQKGMTQTQLAASMDTVSESTVSRWLSDKLEPRDEDLLALSTALEVPVDCLRALRLLDSAGPERKKMYTTAGVAHLLGSGASSTVMLAGLTMLAGTYSFRFVDFEGKTMLVYLIDPESPEVKKFEEDPETIGWHSGSMTLAWLASVSVFIEGHMKAAAKVEKRGEGSSGRVRLWTRQSLDLGDGRREVACNDWIGFESVEDASKRPLRSTRFYGDDGWRGFIAPLMTHLKESQTGRNGESLLWDSDWTKGDPRIEHFRTKLGRIQRGLELERLIEPLL